jgi:hypothetical protein
MEWRLMNIRSSSLFSGSRLAALALAAGLMTLGATSANAQWFRWPRWDAALPAEEVARLLEESGYRLTGPVYRNGPVYVANVVGRGADAERLIIDAHDGRLLQRYALAPARRAAAAAGDWASPRARVSPDDAWLDNEDDVGAPRPPAVVYGDSGASLHLPPLDPAPPLHAPQTNEVARADDSSSSPYVILAPPPAAREPALEKPRPKPQVRHKKPDPTPVASPAATPAPGDAKATPGAPAAATPAASAQPQADAAAASPRVADTKAAPAPEVIAPAPAPPAKAAKPNDVPVAPLE